VLGTLAMFLVGGGILVHGWHSVGEWLEGISHLAGAAAPVASAVLSGVFGLLAGGVALLGVKVVTWARSNLYKK